MPSCAATTNRAAVADAAMIDRPALVLGGTPGCSHIAASAPKQQTAAAIPNTNPPDKSPCSNVRRVCVSESRAIHPSQPGCPARAKSSTQEPMVKASATIAAVAELSETAAANSAIEPTSKP